MQIVYTNGVSEEQLFESVQHFVYVLSMYAKSGSGWIIEKVEISKIDLQNSTLFGGQPI